MGFVELARHLSSDSELGRGGIAEERVGEDVYDDVKASIDCSDNRPWTCQKITQQIVLRKQIVTG